MVITLCILTLKSQQVVIITVDLSIKYLEHLKVGVNRWKNLLKPQKTLSLKLNKNLKKRG